LTSGYPYREPPTVAPLVLYADGGVVGRNDGTNAGGVWAFCWVDEHNTRTWEQGGIYPVAGVGNNTMEYLAIAKALASVADRFPGWSGPVCSDSRNALNAILGNWSCRYVPARWQRRMREVLNTLGDVRGVLLQGHPTREELEVGYGRGRRDANNNSRRGLPVSTHNVWCDGHCNGLKASYYLQLQDRVKPGDIREVAVEATVYGLP
jgi:ribonuclease HI